MKSHVHLILKIILFCSFKRQIERTRLVFEDCPPPQKKIPAESEMLALLKPGLMEKLVWKNQGPEQPLTWQTAILTDGLESRHLRDLSSASCQVVCSGSRQLISSPSCPSEHHCCSPQKCALCSQPGQIQSSGSASEWQVST